MSTEDDCRRLLSLLAHEMRSPGAVVAGYLRMLKGPSTSEMPSREQKMIEEANRSCARLMHIVQELSDFGELANGDLKRAPLPIFTLCDEVVQTAAEEGSDVSFVVDEADRDVMIEGHETRLKQALSALLAAIVRERGSAPVEARAFVHRDPASAVALVSFGEPGTVATAADVLKHQQMPFDRWRGGMGLALPIAHRIVEAHRGSLWAMPGARATCALALPLA